MSVTEQPPAEGPGATDAAQEALEDRIAADSLTTRRDYLRIVATVSGGLAVGGIGVAAGVLHRHGDSEGIPAPKRIAGRCCPGSPSRSATRKKRTAPSPYASETAASSATPPSARISPAGCSGARTGGAKASCTARATKGLRPADR